MAEYEAATLAVRTASLWAVYGQIGATLAIGAGQIAVVWFGIRAMQRASDQRSRDARDEARRLAEADERRHDESMIALRELIARTAAPGAGD